MPDTVIRHYHYIIRSGGAGGCTLKSNHTYTYVYTIYILVKSHRDLPTIYL